ncbi:peptidase insulinase [Enterovibrio norvegicus FF-162]|uniref:insulinase family protein n=1 Tax=Enterovibrio norvegicus TaxID=188144 RepID=UPI0002F7BE44|nr:insulinase family protein [Enterovibrio norvegicus]OEE81520.1 peptidase insulinase [Enterovibrio norvegicus FF-162]
MAKSHPAAPDWLLLPPNEQQLETGWVGYRHVSGALHWHHASSEESRLSAAIVLPTPVNGDSGITHALEHMVLRGSMRYPEPETFLSLRSELALLEFNASTQKETTRFHLSGYDPNSVLRGIGFLADSILSPQLTQEDFDQEIVRQHDSGYDGAMYRELGEYMRHQSFRASTVQAVNSDLRAALYGGMPDTIPKLDIGMLRRYHSHYYRPDNMLLLTSGSWPMVALWRQMSKALNNVGEPLPVSMEIPNIFSDIPLEKDGDRIETLPFSSHWAAAIYPTLNTLKSQQQLKALGAELLPLISDFQPVPALRCRVSAQCDKHALERHIDDCCIRLSSRRAMWQTGCFTLQQGRNMVNRWGNGLQRLYHEFSETPFAPPCLQADVCDSLLQQDPKENAQKRHGEWLSPCPPLTRMAILCRSNVRDAETRSSLERWLVLCQQRTLRWAWMKGKPMLGSMREWHCANALVLGYTVDLPERDVVALRHFWHQTLSADEISAVDGEWQHTPQGIVFCCAGSVPVVRTGAIMASHRDDETAMHVTLSFPHTTEAGAMAALGQAVMASSLVQKRRLGGRCYSVAVSLDLMSFELTFDTVADSDPSVSFIALLNAFETLSLPLGEIGFEQACRGGLGLVSARYNKSHARFHRALLNTVGRSVALDFSVVTPTNLAQLATKVLYALKHPTLH